MDINSTPGLIPELINNLAIAISSENIINASNDIEAISTWLREYRNSKNTLVAYRQCVERFYIWINYQSKKLSEINREDVQNYQDFLAGPQPHSLWCEPKTAKTDPAWKPFVSGLSTSGINHQISILKNLYTYLVQSGYFEDYPTIISKRGDEKKGLSANRLHRIIKQIFAEAANYAASYDSAAANLAYSLSR